MMRIHHLQSSRSCLLLTVGTIVIFTIVQSTIAFSYLPLSQNHRRLHDRNTGVIMWKVGPSSSSRLVVLGASLNLDDVETKAQAASEAWDIYVTPFLPSQDASNVEQRLGNRADVACIKVPSSSLFGETPTSGRLKFLFTNPDLGMDEQTATNEYCVVLHVENIASIENLDPWPNILTSIGVDLNQIGDIYVSGSSGTAYLIVDPDIVKVCTRLLPKELPGAVSVSTIQPNALSSEGFPNDLILQDDMEVKRLDKREQKRK